MKISRLNELNDPFELLAASRSGFFQVLLKQPSNEHMRRIFKTKFAGWSYEREARVYAKLGMRDEATGPFFHSFDDQIRLTDVIAGPLFSGSKLSIEDDLQVVDRNAKVFKARLAFKSFEVVEQKQDF